MINRTLSVAVALALLAGCASSPRFFETRLVASEYDESSAATRVTVSFEVWDADGRPINDIATSDITVLEYGVRASSESETRLESQRHPIDVVLLLDRSASARTGETGGVRELAQALLAGLADQPVHTQLYSFANTVEKLDSLDQLTIAPAGDAKSRWTALYYAIRVVADEYRLTSEAASRRSREGDAPFSPSTVLVVCTDGADNYSHNHDLLTLADLEQQVLADRIVIHALGVGNVAEEVDRQGVDGAEALRRLAANGSFHDAAGDGAVTDVVGRIARQVRATYSCTFVSPSITGEHDLVLELARAGTVGRSAPVRFPTNAPRQAATPTPDRTP